MRQLIFVTSVLTALGLWAPAGASVVYRCESHGKVTYSDTPCDRGQGKQVNAGNPNTTPPLSEEEKRRARENDARVAREKKAAAKANADLARQVGDKNARDERVRTGVVEGKIVRGMTPQQVEEVLGRPGGTSKDVKNNVEKEHWTYDDGSTVQVVTFTGGEVTGYSKRQGSKAHAKKKKKAP